MKETTKTLPITIKYVDNVDLVGKVIDVYTILAGHLPDKTKDLLRVCMVRDMNSSNFYTDVINSDIGYSTVGSARTAVSRLKTDLGLIVVDPIYNKKSLNSTLQGLKRFISGEGDKEIQFKFRKKV